jgi:ABC-2 type transport system ATP-binding protein
MQSGSLADLRHLTRSAVAVRVDDTSSARGALVTLPGVHDLVVDGDRLTFHLDDDATPAVTRTLAGLAPRNLMITPPSLEELFLRQYGDELALLESDEPTNNAAAADGTTPRARTGR